MPSWHRRDVLRALLAGILLPRFGWSAGAEPLRLTYFDGYPPFSFRADGKFQGMLIDILDELLDKRLGRSLQHVGLPWRRAQMLVETGQADGFFTVPTPVRREYAAFTSEPLYKARAAVVFSKNHRLLAKLNQVRHLEDLSELRHGNYLGNGWAGQNLAGMSVEWTPSLDSVLHKIARLRLDVCVDNFPSLYHAARMHPMRHLLIVRPLPDMGYPFPLHLGLRRSLPEHPLLLAQVDDLVNNSDMAALARVIHERYLPGLDAATAALLE